VSIAKTEEYFVKPIALIQSMSFQTTKSTDGADVIPPGIYDKIKASQ
jgi:hypothetical protein